jgi:hypothetical protein
VAAAAAFGVGLTAGYSVVAGPLAYLSSIIDDLAKNKWPSHARATLEANSATADARVRVAEAAEAFAKLADTQPIVGETMKVTGKAVEDLGKNKFANLRNEVVASSKALDDFVRSWAAYADAIFGQTTEAQLAEVKIVDDILNAEKKLLEEGNAAWVAHAEAITDSLEKAQLAEAAIVDDILAAEQKTRDESLRGMVEYAEAVVSEHYEMTKAIAASPTGRSVALDQLADSLRVIRGEAALLGSSFDALTPTIAAMERSIVSMLENGIEPTDAGIQELASKLEGMKEQAATLQLVEQLGTRAASSIADGMTELATKGTLDFAKFADSLIQDLSRIVYQALLTKAVLAAINYGANALTPTPGVEQLAGPGSGYTPPAIPGAAKGAVVKRRPGGRLMVVGEGSEDEGIFPLSRLSTPGDRSGVSIVVNNHASNTQATAREVAQADGKKQVEVLVTSAWGSVASRGGMDTAMSSWGLRRKGKQR